MCNFIYSISEEALILNDIKFHAKSGPYGKGPLPKGFYGVGKLKNIKSKKGFCVNNFCYWIRLKPLFKTDRTGIGIHPDGNIIGTLGCIGLQSYSTEIFHEVWFRLQNRPDILKVIE